MGKRSAGSRRFLPKVHTRAEDAGERGGGTDSLSDTRPGCCPCYDPRRLHPPRLFSSFSLLCRARRGNAETTRRGTVSSRSSPVELSHFDTSTIHPCPTKHTPLIRANICTATWKAAEEIRESLIKRVCVSENKGVVF